MIDLTTATEHAARDYYARMTEGSRTAPTWDDLDPMHRALWIARTEPIVRAATPVIADGLARRIDSAAAVLTARGEAQPWMDEGRVVAGMYRAAELVRTPITPASDAPTPTPDAGTHQEDQ